MRERSKFPVAVQVGRFLIVLLPINFIKIGVSSTTELIGLCKRLWKETTKLRNMPKRLPLMKTGRRSSKHFGTMLFNFSPTNGSNGSTKTQTRRTDKHTRDFTLKNRRTFDLTWEKTWFMKTILSFRSMLNHFLADVMVRRLFRVAFKL